MSNNDVPIWEKYTAGWVILNGNRIQIKRKQFEKIIDSLDTI